MLVAGLGLVTALACASGTGRARRAPPASTTVLLADEIRAVGARTAYEAVLRLRPEWLRRRGAVSIRDPGSGEVVVYVDGVRLGGPGSLGSIPVGSIVLIEYLNPSDAAGRYGPGHLGGAIQVRTR